MRRMKLLIVTIIFNVGIISGQVSEHKLPLHEYKFSAEIELGLNSGDMRISKAAQYYSYIGFYQRALGIPNEVEFEWGFDSLTIEDKQYFNHFTAYDAVQSIIERAKKERVVIINEAHHKPVHRVFIRRLLKGLYDNGYRYFGLEAVANCNFIPKEYCDTLLNSRGYPLNSPYSGTYITEPQMSNLITEAIQIGFEIFAYEGFGKERDKNQAIQIANVLNSNLDSKILILCGWHHLLEEEDKGKKWMATYLQEITGINPFTIYQDILMERVCVKESPFYKMINFKHTKVFISNKGKFYNGFKNFKLFDALVYHPRTKYIFNRPDWLLKYPGNKIYKVNEVSISYPCIIKAYAKNRTLNSVPVDIIEKRFIGDHTVLVLPKGAYTLEIYNMKGEVELRNIVVN